jgi:tetratricopeptide (TPR) repeat protein
MYDTHCHGSDLRHPAASASIRVLLAVAVIAFLLPRAYAQRSAPGSAEAHYNRGLALLQNEQTDRAIAELKSAITLKPAFADAHNSLGLALARKGELEPAVQSFRKAIALDPKLYKAHRNLGTALQQLGDVDGAIEAFRKSASIQGDDADTHLLLGVALQRKQLVDDSIAELREAERLIPTWSKRTITSGTRSQPKAIFERPSLSSKSW